MRKILVSGGAGYVGSVLVPALLKAGHEVRVFDTFWFWNSTADFLASIDRSLRSNVQILQGDIRELSDVRRALKDCDTVIQLACISNDPSSDLDSKFTHEVNYDGNILMIDEAKRMGVERFIYASSSSVYGVKSEPNVTEEMSLEPLTQYSKLKVEVENYLLTKIDRDFKAVIIRPSTVCGFSPRQRLDVVVNLLTDFAVNSRKIRVFGGDQLRPNIHIDDMVDLYVKLSAMEFHSISGKIFNAGWDNLKVKEIATLVSDVVSQDEKFGKVEMEFVPSDDNRSYHVSSEKIARELGFRSQKSVRDAIIEMTEAFTSGKITDSKAPRYHNVRQMKLLLERSH